MEIRTKKKFGQNFIYDKNLINKIIKTLENEETIFNNKKNLVIEIGPGLGALTEELLKKFSKVIAIEIDKDLSEVLKKKFASSNFELIIEDVLKINFQEIIDKNKKKFDNIYLISNLPYYITTPILFKTLPILKKFKKVVFMMQKEVAERITADVGDSNYNNLSVVSEFYSIRKYEFTVKKTNFKPVPKVDSAIVSFFYNNEKETVNDSIRFVNFVRILFNNRRKTILNNIDRIVNDKELSKQILEAANIDSGLRAENISLNNFINLYKKFTKIYK